MKLKVKPRVASEVDAKVMKIHLKVCDMFSASIVDGNGQTIWDQDDGYVPRFMPEGGGDYLVLDIEIDTGRVLNWKLDPRKLAAAIEGAGDDE